MLAVLTIVAATGASRGLDRVVLDAVQTPHERWLDVAASVVSLFGSAELTGGLALGFAAARLRRKQSDWWVPLAIAATVAVEAVLKLTIAQPAAPHELSRAVPILPTVSVPFPYSFPSGHLARTAFLVTIARLPVWLGIAAVVVMGITRVYLAEHWSM